MTVQEAQEKLISVFPDLTPVGYWVRDDGFIFNTKSIFANPAAPFPAQFVVTHAGRVYGTNSMRDNISQKTMIKLR